MNWLLVFVPVAIALEYLAPDRHLLIFVSSGLAILPLGTSRHFSAILGSSKSNDTMASLFEKAMFDDRRFGSNASASTGP